MLRFDYNSSDLSDDVKNLLRQLAEQVPPNSTIVIDGSADVLGSDLRNKVLSQERGTGTEQFMTSVAVQKLKYRTSTRSEKFSDSTPQGRFLNRSIHVRVVAE